MIASKPTPPPLPAFPLCCWCLLPRFSTFASPFQSQASSWSTLQPPGGPGKDLLPSLLCFADPDQPQPQHSPQGSSPPEWGGIRRSPPVLSVVAMEAEGASRTRRSLAAAPLPVLDKSLLTLTTTLLPSRQVQAPWPELCSSVSLQEVRSPHFSSSFGLV